VKTVIAVAAVLLVFTGLMAVMYRNAIGAARENAEISQMRRIYGAWYLYGQDWNGTVALNLYDVRDRLPDDRLLAVENDPFLKHPGPYPVDPVLWDSPRKNPLRVSFSYLGAFATEGKVKVNWDLALENPRAGLLANPFSGEISPDASGWAFGRQGRLTRISVLGAASTVDKAGVSPASLFGEY
jgi:hypothetical protein